MASLFHKEASFPIQPLKIEIGGFQIGFFSAQLANDRGGEIDTKKQGTSQDAAGCDTEIERGDLLVTASTDGYAQSVDAVMPESWQQVWNKLGSPFAKALEPCSEGTNIIRAWII